MQSKTSFFNGTLFRKNLTRFAPVWGGYLLCLLLGMVILAGDEADYWRASSFAMLTSISGMLNLGYALLAAAVLFGDLYNSRMCNALHAMPITRESWFGTNILSGLLFNLVPTTIMALCAIPMLIPTPVEGAWSISLYWLAMTNLEFLFFYSVAVLCVMCVGSRVGLAGMYAIVNFGAYIVYFLINIVFTPMLHGVVLRQSSFRPLCPVMNLVDRDAQRNDNFINTVSFNVKEGEDWVLHGTMNLGENAWNYLFLLTAIGIALLIIALVLYRRRKLEVAGDLMAFRALEPVILVCAAIAAAAVFVGVYESFAESPVVQLIFLYVGLIAGWFAAKMLIERNVQVFRLKNFRGLAMLAAAMAVCLVLTYFDVLGIETWVPKLDKVESVELNNDYYGAGTLEDPEQIQEILQLHANCAQERLTWEQVNEKREQIYQETGDREHAEGHAVLISLNYNLKSGRTASRSYYVWAGSESGQIVKKYSSTIEAVLRRARWIDKDVTVKTLEDLLEQVQVPDYIAVSDIILRKENLTEENVEALFRAIAADCAAQTLSQDSSFHPLIQVEHPTKVDAEGDKVQRKVYNFDLSLTFPENEHGERDQIYLDFFADSEHMLAWAESVGITMDMMIREYTDMEEYNLTIIPAAG